MEPVFADTLNMSRRLPLIPTVKYRGLLNDFVFSFEKKSEGATIVFKNVDCIDECAHLLRQYPNDRVGLLNMASDIRPGGGVLKGSRAQEEDICRRTNLYLTISNQTYPLRSDDIMFSPNVRILKDSNYVAIKEVPPMIHGVLTCAALRRPAVSQTPHGLYYTNASDKETMRLKIQLLLQTAAYHELDCLVLGAWGCGAFYNPVEEVAKLFAEEFSKAPTRNAFKHVTFAILNNSHRQLCDEFRVAFSSALRV